MLIPDLAFIYSYMLSFSYSSDSSFLHFFLLSLQLDLTSGWHPLTQQSVL